MGRGTCIRGSRSLANPYGPRTCLGDRAKYIGIIIGLTFASLLITQRAAIFVGIMNRTFSFLTDAGLPDVWVVDPQAQYIEDIKPLRDTEVLRVRGVEGIRWSVPMYKGSLRARRDDGTFQSCVVIGLDDATLIGGPPQMLAGTLANLYYWAETAPVRATCLRPS